MERPRLFATTNANKLREFNEILGWDLEQHEIDLLEPQGLDVVSIVETKAADAYARIGKPVLVEDTGLELLAWNGLPGALIKWFMETVGREGFLKLLVSEKDRRAVARTAVGFADSTGPHVVVGERHGSIASRVRGEHGFGWDSIFIPDASDETYAEMGAVKKNLDSQRTRALRALKELVEG